MSTNNSLIQLVRGFTDQIDNGRTLQDIFDHGFNEMDKELRPEVAKAMAGEPEGEDGVVGESMDVILCKLDLIFKHRPGITEEELLGIALRKCQKWAEKYRDKPSSSTAV